jgi:hypothetical protein
LSIATRRTALLALAAALLCSLVAAHAARAATKLCPERFSIAAGGSTFQLPYCANRSLSARDDGVHRLVVVVHGTNRNATDYYSYMNSAAHDAGADDSLVVAPQFLIASEAPKADTLHWTAEGWKQGDESDMSPSVSSFAAVDQLVRSVVGSMDFPNLREVVVTGHSAGGQFAERYAATNRIDGTLGVPLRYVVANPSSYLYLNSERPVSGSADQFATPSSSSCSGYDTYKYGVNALNPYLAASGADGIRAQFRARHVAYLLGSKDTDPNDSSLDKSCEGEMQGSYRLQRGTAFFNYLGRFYGSSVYDTQSKTIVQGVAHDGYAMFDSPEGRGVLFGSSSAPAPQPQPQPQPAPEPQPQPEPAPAEAPLAPVVVAPLPAAAAPPARAAAPKRAVSRKRAASRKRATKRCRTRKARGHRTRCRARVRHRTRARRRS